MLLRFSLATLLILASHLSYSQYPVIKVLGKDTVVIMTLKQGEDINKKFSTLSDSIKALSEQITITGKTVQTLETEKVELSKNISNVNKDLANSYSEINKLNILLAKRDREFWNEKKSWGGWMLFSFMVTIMVAALK